MPTYKFDAGARDVYDTSSKARVPSWTDRIQWRDALLHTRAATNTKNKRRSSNGGGSGGTKEGEEEGRMRLLYYSSLAHVR